MSLLEEHTFCAELCAFARIVRACAQDLVDYTSDQRTLLPYDDKRHPFVVFDPVVLFDVDHVVFTLRNVTKICVGMAVGYVGYAPIIAARSAALANQQAIMINQRSTGSELAKNLTRIYAVVIATLVGQISNTFFALTINESKILLKYIFDQIDLQSFS